MNAGFILLWYLFLALQVLLASFLLQPFILLSIDFGWKLFARPARAVRKTTIRKKYGFGIVITAHRETDFLPPIIDSLVRQTYPHFKVYIVADDCDISRLRFEDPRITLLSPPVSLNSKNKSIAYALEHFNDSDEVLVIFDPDNLVHPRYLEILNTWYNRGYLAVQGNLQAKNTGGPYEKMDSVGVLFNNFIDRDMRARLGCSINIWGCGISVDSSIYRKIIYDERTRTGGFDKHMQVEIVKNVPRIAYAGDAIVYDEKVDDGHSFEQQRTRWIRAYFKFLGEAFGLLFRGIRRWEGNLIYFGYNLVRPPYFLQILLAALFIRADWKFHPALSISWMIVLFIFLISFIVIVVISASGKTVSKGFWYMPLLFFHQLRSLFKIRINRNSFLKTEHSKILYIDDLLKHVPHS